MSTYYECIIEWDGLKYNGSFRNRCKALGIQIMRDSKEKDANGNPVPRNPNPQERRAIAEGMVIVQEGCIMCATPELAREIAMLAKNYGARDVKIGKVDLIDFFATTEDVKIHQRIEDLAGRRGRRSVGEQSQDWDVVCYNECDVYSENDVRYVINCPHCGGLKLKAYPKGKIKRYQMPDDNPGEGMLARWIRTAFANGEFVPCAASGDVPPASQRVPTNGEGKVVDIILRSPELADEKLNKLNPWVAANILDAVFIARFAMARDIRIEHRVNTCVKLLGGGADPAKVPVSEDDFRFDVIDGSSVIGEDVAAGVWKSINQ